jgi:hypothetical protein
MVYLYDACDQISDFCHQQVTEKNAAKNILDGRKDGRTDGQRENSIPPSPFGEQGYNYSIFELQEFNTVKIIKSLKLWKN